MKTKYVITAIIAATAIAMFAVSKITTASYSALLGGALEIEAGLGFMALLAFGK